MTDAYWELVVADIVDALAVLRPIFDASAGTDGFVSVEVAPELARDTDATIAAARHLHERIDEPNLFVKIPATAEGVPAIQAMIAEGRSINITLIFSLARYAEVIEAYLAGLEALAEGGGDPASVHSVASFFVSRVDTEVDRRLDAIGTGDALALQGQAAVAQAKLAYQLFRDRFAGERWERAGGPGRPGAAAAVGVDVDQEPRLPRHPLRRQPHRARHGQHPARGHHRRVRGPRHPRPHHRQRRRRRRRGDATAWPRSASTWTTSAAPSRTRAWPASTSRSPTCSRPSTPRRASWRRADMDWAGWALFGLVATAALTAVMIIAQLAGLTRLDLPLLLGTIVTDDPDRARVAGFFLHLVIGQGFALGYAACFSLLDRASWWLGGLFGLLHVAVSLTVFVPLLEGVHPRMASHRAGRSSTAVLEPPGLGGLNYGGQTPVVTIAAHLTYGVALGMLLGAR